MAKVKKEEQPVVKMGNEKRKAVLAALSKIQEDFGADVAFYGNDSKTLDIECIPTGSLGLDAAIGGGIPRGRITEISGPESSGKTLVALSTIAQCQKAGGQAVFVDVEQSISKEWCKKLGVNFDELIVSQPNSGEQALDVVCKFVETNAVDIIVLDSVAMLVSQRELDGEFTDQHMAVQARMLTLGLKKLLPVIARSKVACIFINQQRTNIGTYGNPIQTPGGKALKYAASVRISTNKESKSEVLVNGEQVGHTMKTKVIKNKISAPFKEASFGILYNSGINQKSEIAELAVKKGIVKLEKTSYLYEDNKWVGRAKYEDAIKQSPELAEKLFEEIKTAVAEKRQDVEEISGVEEVDGMLVDKSTGEIIDDAKQEGDLE